MKKAFFFAVSFIALTLGIQAQNSRTTSPKALRQFQSRIHKETVQTSAKTQNTWTPLRSIWYAWQTNNSTWDTTAKHHFTYFWNGEIESDSSSILGLQGWEPFEKVVNILDGNNRISDSERYAWSSNGWEYQGKDFTRWDAQGNEILSGSIGSFWGTPLDTLYATRMVYEYDSQNRVTKEEYYSLFMGVWSADYRTLYTYTAAGEIASEENYGWNGAWEKEALMTISYNTQGQPDTMLIYDWANGAWSPEMRLLDLGWYDYSKELIQSYREQYMDNGGWVDAGRANYTYGPNDGYEGIYESYANGAWTPDFKESLEIDAEGNETLNEQLSYQNTAWVVDYGEKNIYVYDANGNILSEENEYFETNQMTYVPNSRIEYYDIVLDREPLTLSSELKLWPQPAKDRLYFALGEGAEGKFQLLDLQGRILQQGEVSRGLSQSLDLGQTQSGIYLLKIEQNGQSFSKKVLIL